MSDTYFREITKHFIDIDPDRLPSKARTCLKWSLANYVAQRSLAAYMDTCSGIADMYRSMRTDRCLQGVWGKHISPEDWYVPADRAFLNACRVSNLELDDSTRGSVHPGSYIWSAVLAECMKDDIPVDAVARAVLLGYEVTTRAAMMGEKKAISMGLHAPGVFGALGAAAAVALIKGRDLPAEECIENILDAIGIAASLMPVCPFTSFIEGSDAKDLYGGWGTYLGVIAGEGAVLGLKGPRNILSGIKSLESLFSADTGKDVPIGKPYMIELLNVKQYPACFSVIPASNAALQLRDINGISIEDVESIEIYSYPYSVDIDPKTRELNPTSARLSIAYNVITALDKGEVNVEAFDTPDKMPEKYIGLMEKTLVSADESYGRGTDALRAARVAVKCTDGRLLEKEFSAGNVAGGTGDGLNDSSFKTRFLDLTLQSLGKERSKEVYDLMIGPDILPELSRIIPFIL